MGFQRHHSALIVASLVTVASFIGATVLTQYRLTRLDALSSTIENDAVPSTAYLSSAAVRLTHLSQLLEEIADAGPKGSAALPAARQEVLAIDADVRRYLQLPTLYGEREFWATRRGDVDRALRLVRKALDDEERDKHLTAATLDALDDALDRAIRSVLAALDFGVRQSQEMARGVRSVRTATLRAIVFLDAVATFVALVAVLFAYRASRRHDELLNDHARLLAARVTELDRFAGRVAHDVLSPLGTIATALPLLAASGDERSRIYVGRSERALRRVQQLVDDLLTFARSGANRDPEARCPIHSVLAGIVADCSEEAAANGIELVSEVSNSIEVPCSVGVITSIIQNLVRNAIKYIGDRPVKRIVVRARRAGHVVRLEVEDTGPGIPSNLQASIFDPFVRGDHEDVTGTGLGLATVKRLAESHGGAAGVQSKVNDGSLFWVELPLAAADAEHAPL